MWNIHLHYTITGTGDISNVKLKRGNLPDIEQVTLEILLGRGFQENQTKSCVITIGSANADSLTIYLWLEGLPNTTPFIINWEKPPTGSKNKKNT